MHIQYIADINALYTVTLLHITSIDLQSSTAVGKVR